MALIKNRLTFILHEISDEKTVYTVFEVLNSRGMDVAWLDRLKSILMGMAFSLDDNLTRKSLIDDLHQSWRDLYSTIGLRQGLSAEALRFAATLYQRTQPSKPLGEEDAVDTLREIAQKNGAKSIREVAGWLLKVTNACEAVRSNPRQDAVTQITQARLLAVALHVSAFRRTQKEELLTTWETVSFRIYGLYDKDARTGVGDYCRLAWDVAQGRITANKTRERILEIGADFPIDGAIRNLRDQDCYTEWTDDLRYLLFRYEEHSAQEAGLQVDNNHWEHVWAKNANLSIEHIRPRSKAPKSIKHNLGNLMLLPPGLNSRLRDRPPSEKSEAYRKTGFYQAEEVASMLEETPAWTKAAVKVREKKLLDWARKEWGD